jgi:flagellar biosynthesis protein FlhF
MKITRHVAPDMRQALRLVREQLGPDAVILSSRRTSAGVEITAAMDFDAEELRAAEALGKATETPTPSQTGVPTAHAAPPAQITANTQPARVTQSLVHAQASSRTQAAQSPARAVANAFAGAEARVAHTQAAALAHAKAEQAKQTSPASQMTGRAPLSSSAEILMRSTAMRTQTASRATQAFAQGNGHVQSTHSATQGNGHAQSTHSATQGNGHAQSTHSATQGNGHAQSTHSAAQRNTANTQAPPATFALHTQGNAAPSTAHTQPTRGGARSDASNAASSGAYTQSNDRALTTEVTATHSAPADVFEDELKRAREALNAYDTQVLVNQLTANQEFSPQAFVTHAPRHAPAPQDHIELEATDAGFPTARPADILDIGAPTSPTDLMGNELKTLRRMLETQMAQLAWNDLSRRAPIHTEMLRELTEIGLGQELAAQVVAQLPAHTDLTQARRLAIAALSQQVLVTGDRWLEDGGCVALVGPTGVGKTTTLAKLAVRWVLRHGARDLALIAGDAARIGAHEQMNTLGQLLGAPVYTVHALEELPALLDKLAKTRFVLIDTPGSSQRDALLASRLAALSAVGPRLETALVLAASTQAGAIAEVVQRFAAVSPASCVLTKVDEAASLGGVLSVLVRARLPISYMSEGQRVPEDLRPARSLELVSSAVQLAHTAGAAADEDLLRRRFGEMAHAIA